MGETNTSRWRSGGAAWLKHQLAARLQPGEEGSPWQTYGRGMPGYVLGSVRQTGLE
jgi:hypothetical protein